MHDIDFSRFPSKTFQLEWLREYLNNYHKYDGIPVTDEYLNGVYVQVNQFVLAAHFLWAAWGLIQAEHSTLDYDYIG